MKPARYHIRYSQLALNDLAKLSSRQTAQIMKKILRLETGLHGNIKRLQNTDFGFRLRMGDYRVLFDVQGNTILIQKIGHRKEVYD